MNKFTHSILLLIFLLFLLQASMAASPGLKAGVIFRDCPDCPEMVVIPKGGFEMGNAKGEENEKPVHRVTITRAFAIGKTEVTQGQWKQVMGDNPSYFKKCGDNCPVEQVSYDDVQRYITKLNTITGKQYRLPSEAEWEYACRAGDKHEYCGSNNVGSVAWYGALSKPPGNSAASTNPVGLKQANAFGLFDMSGNVWEWVEDGYHANYKNAPTDGRVWQVSMEAQRGEVVKHMLRGGAWDDEAEFSSAASRTMKAAMLSTNFDGFRLALTLP